jgi:hypothetical protein
LAQGGKMGPMNRFSTHAPFPASLAFQPWPHGLGMLSYIGKDEPTQQPDVFVAGPCREKAGLEVWARKLGLSPSVYLKICKRKIIGEYQFYLVFIPLFTVLISELFLLAKPCFR